MTIEDYVKQVKKKEEEIAPILIEKFIFHHIDIIEKDGETSFRSNKVTDFNFNKYHRPIIDIFKKKYIVLEEYEWGDTIYTIKK